MTKSILFLFMLASSGFAQISVLTAGTPDPYGQYPLQVWSNGLVYAGGAIGGGVNNTPYGVYALANLNTGSGDTGIGFDALSNITTPSGDTGVGYDACWADSTGEGNTCLGSQAGLYITTGLENTFIGEEAGHMTGSGLTPAGGIASYNAVFGGQAGFSLNNGTNNVLTGYRAGDFVSDGSYNVVVGDEAGASVTTGSEDTLIGAAAQVSSPTDTNEIVVGENVTGAGSNTAVIGTVIQTDVYLGGTSGASVEHSSGYIGPVTAPSGPCSRSGEWVFSQDGHATFCSGGVWTTRI